MTTPSDTSRMDVSNLNEAAQEVWLHGEVAYLILNYRYFVQKFPLRISFFLNMWCEFLRIFTTYWRTQYLNPLKNEVYVIYFTQKRW